MSDLPVLDPLPQPIQMPDGSGHLAYRRLGRGPITLLAFHGFGQDGQVFDRLASSLGDRFSVIAVDLFFHGQSQLAADRLLAKSDWWQLIDALLDQEHIRRFSVLGFSLGGRFALTTVEAFATRIDTLYLVAPDGITRSQWYDVATGSMIGRWLFRQVLQYQSLSNRFGTGLARIGVLHRSAMRFAEGSLATPSQRAQLYRSWVNFRRIQPELGLVSTWLNDMATNVQFYVGSQDRIVPPTYIDPLMRQLPSAQLTTFPVGHSRLLEKVIEAIGVQ